MRRPKEQARRVVEAAQVIVAQVDVKAAGKGWLSHVNIKKIKL
jgi:hypothetical protein